MSLMFETYDPIYVELPRCPTCGSMGHSWCNGTAMRTPENTPDKLWEILKVLEEIKALLQERAAETKEEEKKA